MTKWLSILLFACMAQAEDRPSGAYFGGGLDIGTLSGVYGSENSNFDRKGYSAEAGLNLSNATWGLSLGVEIGSSTGVNKLKSTNSLEVFDLVQYAARVGVVVNSVVIGAGYRNMDLTVRSVIAPAPGYLESQFKGWIPFAYANYSFSLRRPFFLNVEGQSSTGSLSAPGANSMKVQEMILGARFIIHLN